MEPKENFDREIESGERFQFGKFGPIFLEI